MLSNEILSLLKENVKVVIPDLGAIMIRQGDGKLTFNELLKVNDGLLVDHVAQKKGIEKVDAFKEIKQFTNHIIKSLAKSKECELVPLGTLYIDDDERIQIRSSAVVEHAEKEKPETYEIKEPYKNPKSGLLKEPGESETNTSTTLKKTPMFENAPLSKPDNRKDTSAMDDYSYNDRKPVGKILLISIVVTGLLAAGVYFGFINRPAFLTRHSTAMVTDSASIADPKPEVIQEPKAEPVAVADESPAATTTANNRYHIIAGAFIVEKNADAFMQKLQKNGYDPKIVLKRNEYSFVSIFSYPTFREANEKYHSISGMPVWIMKY